MPDEKKTAPDSPVEERMQEATEQGFVGSTPDQTPNEAYTVKGVTSGQSTPETQKPKQDKP